MPTLEERVAGGLVGLLVGDALGVPYEFHDARAIPPLDAIELEPPAGFSRAHRGVPPGTWSDDGAQALCLLESLLHVGAFDAEDFARRMVRWLQDGHLAVDARVFDVGIQTSRSLRSIRGGSPALGPETSDPSTNGNGGLMRVLPLALWHRGTDAELVRDARLSSRVTHSHLRSQLCCALHCLFARRVMRGEIDAGDSQAAWSASVATLRSLLAGDAAALAELDTEIRPDGEAAGAGSGYVVDALHSARMVLARGPYESVVKAAVALGDDTDTTAAIAGGVAGVRDGIGLIPQRFRDGLRGRELYEPLLERLLLHVSQR